MGGEELPGGPDGRGSGQRALEPGKKRGGDAERRRAPAGPRGARTSPAFRAARRTRRARAARHHWLPSCPSPPSHWPSCRASRRRVLLLAQPPLAASCRFPPPRENNFIEALAGGRGPNVRGRLPPEAAGSRLPPASPRCAEIRDTQTEIAWMGLFLSVPLLPS